MTRREDDPGSHDITFGKLVQIFGGRQDERANILRNIENQQQGDALAVHSEGATRALERKNLELYNAMTDVAARIATGEPLSDILAQHPELTQQNLTELFGFAELTPLLPAPLPEQETARKKTKKKEHPQKKVLQTFGNIMRTEENTLTLEQKRIELFARFPEVASLFGQEDRWREIDGQQYIPAIVLHGLLGRSDGKPYKKSSAFQVFYLYWRPWTETHHTRTLRGKENGRPMLVSKTDATQFLWVLDIALSRSRSVYRLGAHDDGDIATDPDEVKKNNEFGTQLTADASSPDSPSSDISPDLSQ